MKAAVTKAPRQLEMTDVPFPTLGSGEALLRVEAVGICGSDKHLYLGTHPYSAFPLIQGHEFSGTIDQLPDGYDGHLQVGERVAVEPLVACGTCYPCRNGHKGCCANMEVIGAHLPGALEELVAVPTGLLYRTTLSAELAALVEPMSIGVQAVERGGLTREDSVVVFGSGPIGLSVLFAAQDCGASVLMIDPLQFRLDLAERLGADTCVWSDPQEVAHAVAGWAGGDGPSVAMDATGLPDAIAAACHVVVKAGRVVVIGQTNQDVTLPVRIFTEKELTIVGSQNNSGVFARTVEMVESRQEWVEALVSHRFPFSQVRDAFEFAVENEATTEKIMIEMAA